MLRVAIYSGAIPATTFIQNLIQEVSGNGIEVLIFGTLVERPTNKAKNVKYYPTFGGGVSRRVQLAYRLILLFFKDIKAFIFLVKDFTINRSINRIARFAPVLLHKPDVFHIQWVKSAPGWIFLKEKFGIHVAVSLRGAHINYSPLSDPELASSYRQVFPLLSGIHAVSEDLAVKGSTYGADRKNISVMYTGIPYSHIVDEIRPAGSSQSKLSLVSVGRVHWKKGYDIALDAMHLLLKWQIPFHYKIIAGKPNEELLYQISQLGLEEHVSFVDKMPHNEVIRIIQESDILVLPSVEEGIANVAVEAMASGTLVLSSDCGGMKELINNGVTGYLFDTYDPNALAEKVRFIAKQTPENIDQIKRAAVLQIKERFTLERLGREMSEWYIKIAR